MQKKVSIDEKFILIAIPILFLLGALLHFVYEWSSDNFIVSLFAPVNESVWEHMKLAVIPTTLWWVLQYSISRRRLKGNRDSWFTGALVSVIISTITIPLVYYFYTGAFGIENPIVDMLILLLGNILGQLVAFKIVRSGKGISIYLSLIMLILIILIFAMFTVFPPSFPIFTPPV